MKFFCFTDQSFARFNLHSLVMIIQNLTVHRKRQHYCVGIGNKTECKYRNWMHRMQISNCRHRIKWKLWDEMIYHQFINTLIIVHSIRDLWRFAPEKDGCLRARQWMLHPSVWHVQWKAQWITTKICTTSKHYDWKLEGISHFAANITVVRYIHSILNVKN